MYNIKENIDIIKSKIEYTHKNSNFAKYPPPKLVAVSKKQNEEKIIEALMAGHKYFGENRVQEAQERWALKTQQFKNLEIRLIGPLQTNKVKQALNLFDVIETIDREKLANEIAKKFNENVKTKGFFIQVNTGSETQKSGTLFTFNLILAHISFNAEIKALICFASTSFTSNFLFNITAAIINVPATILSLIIL